MCVCDTVQVSEEGIFKGSIRVDQVVIEIKIDAQEFVTKIEGRVSIDRPVHTRQFTQESCIVDLHGPVPLLIANKDHIDGQILLDVLEAARI